jgi:hypothetical protein
MRKIILIILVVFFLGFAEMVRATLVNSNSLIQDDIEYYVQTDKSVYDLGENVEMLYRVTNLGTEDVTFAFSQSPEWNFWVEKDGENIWTAVEGWWTFGTAFTLTPSEYKEYPYEWDMRDDEDNIVNLGAYDVIGGLDGGTSISTKEWEFTEVAVPITIIPEPTTFLLLGMGGILLRNGENLCGILTVKMV